MPTIASRAPPAAASGAINHCRNMSHKTHTLKLIGLVLAPMAGLGMVAGAATPQAEPPGAIAPAPLEQVRSLYPAAFTAIGADCPAPATLSVATDQNSDGRNYASLYCWEPPAAKGDRVGQWLGHLPMEEGDNPFVTPWRCPPGDNACAALWPQLLERYPSAIAQAEFNCAVKNGILFLAARPDAVDLRCGFFATTVWDDNGDGQVDYEDPVSVDVSATLLPWPQE